MAYYEGIERTGMELQREVIITADQLDNRFGSLWQRGAGTKITLEETARLALIDSDNTAAIILAKHVNNQDYVDVYNSLDIALPQNISDPVSLSVKGYTSILKALYFASVINKDHSQAILTMLTETKFTDKLPAGVPSGIPVAHKIGVEDDILYQDCGIVFAPRRPYMLCMFSKSNEDIARRRMKLLSETVYHFIASVNE
jgi:beta-lactamase class A